MNTFPFKIRALTRLEKKIMEGYYIGDGKMSVSGLPVPFYTDTMSVFTGRTDVNGCDIYTGDIVKCTISWYRCSTEFKGVCHYNEKRCSFEVADEKQTMELADIVYVNSGNFHSYSKRQFEVVGSMLDKKIKLYQQTGKC